MYRKSIVLSFLSFFFFLVYCTQDSNEGHDKLIRRRLTSQLDTLEMIVESQLLPLARKGDGESLKKVFSQCRMKYKELEWFTEYYAPLSSREINGPPVPEIEVEENKVLRPKGFQVIEEYLFPEYVSSEQSELLAEIKSMLSILGKIRVILNSTEFSEAHVMEACRLEVFRVISLGISGFDTPLSLTGLAESATALKEVSNVLDFLGENPKLQKLVDEAVLALRSEKDFNSFDRLAFINNYANPLTTEMVSWKKELGIEPLREQFAVNQNASTLFDKNALNVDFFTGNKESRISEAKVELGESLFSDKMVSGGNMTCKSCHQPALAFTDGQPKSVSFTQGQFVKRNAATLYYAGFQNEQFYDMRAPSLESQAFDVISNKDEMHGSVEDAAARMNKDAGYIKRFKAAFPSMEKDIKPRYVMIAIASYIRSLAPFNSKFDMYMRGDRRQMNQEEKNGFNLFMGKGKCGTCHFMPLFNGTAPPAFTHTEAEVLGVPAGPGIGKVDADAGRYTNHQIDELKFSFKTPTVRNIEKTAPYMHNGAFRTLEEVMEFYNEGGGEGLGIELDNQTLPADKLNLTPNEQKAIIAFLKTLTDEVDLVKTGDRL
ncbi:cytochrome-c peroxidase [Desertivirga xinjiangensis]|uniref:cytochrome-c peroxidase n=1 Tax=Desertivirga xinjiangensis TaxID=539206 RepID=UPI0021095DC4|nr:cytochrome c peroxidase [Pedobacter xinjiangensis]